MADRPADRLPDVEEEQPEYYKKDKGSAQIHGQIFEYKLCALVFLRATNNGYKFKLASNVEGYGKFDDVVVEYVKENSRKKHIFLQLKSKMNQKITMQQLLAGKGDFSLHKYYESYIHIEEKFNCNEEGVKMDGSTDESLFIIYTNTDVVQELKSYNVIDFGEEEFLMTGGSMLQFNEEKHKTIYEHLQELPKHREFLSRFRICYSQAKEYEMDCTIKRELQRSMKLPESELDLTYKSFLPIIQNWWQNCNYFLQDTNCKKNDPLLKTSEEVRPTIVAKILERRKTEIDELSIKYKQSAITDMKQLTEPHKALLIFSPGHSTTLTAAKIHQMFSATTHIILKLQQLIRYKTEVMFAWKSKFDVLMLESDSSAEVSADLFNELYCFVNSSVAEKKFIFISNNVGNIKQINNLRRTFQTNLTEEYDDCKFTDIVTASRMSFLNKKVYFQGVEVKLSTIVKNDNVGVLNALDCDSISLLLENEKPSIGIRSEDTIEYYIDRTLQQSKEDNTRFPGQGEIQLASRGDILREIRDSSPHLEGKLERETDTFWKPKTLIDGEGRIILVTDEPGMGKSTFLTHLANETLERHPDLWIVRININNYTRILHELKNNGCDQNGVIKLLTEAAQIKKSDGVVLEGHLLNYTYNSTGNMAVLIDGVDEVSPHYTEVVIQFVKLLSETKIKRIWVTSRNLFRGLLETEFQCQSYSLVPFSEENQKRFLVKFWNNSCPQKRVDYLENLANRVVKLSNEQLTVQAKKFMGIPLQSLLLAEMFERNLKQCTTAGTVELPEYINVVMLYDLYVDKKWVVYLSEKKKSDRTNVNVLADDNALRKTFMHNHMAAALLAILSRAQLQKLTDKLVVEGVRTFLQKITEGIEKTGIIIDVIEGRPVFQHRTLAEYFVASWLCDNICDKNSAVKIFMRDHLFESVFDVVRSMVDRILADKYPLHEAVLNSDMRYVAKLLERKESITQNDRGRRTPLHVAVSCRIPEIIRLLLEHGADVRSVDTFLGLSPVEYATRIADWQVLSLLMEKRPEIREQVLHEMSSVSTTCEYEDINGQVYHEMDCVCSSVFALRAAARYGHTYLLQYLISRENCVNLVFPDDSGTLLHEAARGNHIQTIRTLVDLGADCDAQDANGRTVLHVSAETGSPEVAKYIVERQEITSGEGEMNHILTSDRTVTKLKRLNAHDKDGNTPLHLAAAAGNTSTVLYLLSAGSDVRSCNTRGEYPLLLAARYGRNDTVKLLLQIRYALKCEEKASALRAAILAGQVDTTALLLRSGAPVSGVENEKPIHVASRMGHKEIVSLLMHFGACLTSRTDSGNTALHLASETGHLSLVKHLVELQRDGMCCTNYEIETPLHSAARNGRDYIVIYFAKNGCNINAPSANGATCLHVACENGHYTTVECLLKQGAEVNAMNSADQTPLHIAACCGQTKIVELLFLHNANFSLKDKDGITALLAASINGHQDTVRFIVQHGGNIEDIDGKGNTVAHFAVTNENCDILKFLSKQDANLEVQNYDGDTPLLKAVREERMRVVKCLAAKLSDINTKGTDGLKPLDVAVLKGNMDITRLLLERNARSWKTNMHIIVAARFGFLESLRRFVTFGDDINVKADNGESPLHAACNSGHVATVQYLCGHDAILDWQDNNGNTALHVAVGNGHLDATRILVKKGANLCAADTSGSTALHIAAKRGYLNIVQYLADSLAPIDMRNAKMETALLVATAEGYQNIVRVLIEQGAGIGVRDIEGKTALDIATEKGYGVIIQLLKNRAEGRTLVCSNSYTVPQTGLAGAIYENIQITVNADVSIGNARQEVDAGRIIKTRADVTLELSNHRCALKTAAENGDFKQVERLLKTGIALDYCDTFGRTALWGAASRGHKNITRLLLANGSCTNIPDCEGMTPIEIAAREGHWDVVDEFLEYDPTISPEGTEYLSSQLYEASESGEPEVLGIILKCGISVNTTNEYGHTPLHVAVMSGQTEITRILLRSGAKVNIADDRGKIPLTVAAEKGHVEIIRNLLSDDAYLDSFKTFSSAALSEQEEVIREESNNCTSVVTYIENALTSLKTEALKEEKQDFRRSLNYGGSVDITDEDGSTPLYVAALNGRLEAVREFLKHGASVNSENESGSTPIKAAVSEGHVEVVRELLNHGANSDSSDNNGWTPLNAAAQEGYVEIISELLNNGANVNSANNDGYTPLYTAASKGQVEVIRQLLENGASVHSADNNGRTPLNAAAKKGHSESIRELIKCGANLESADKDGRTPLYTAASSGHLEVVQELLKRGAKVKSADKDGWTPLKAATSNGHLEVVLELLNHGAKMKSAKKDGRTPLYTAATNGHLEVVRELLKRGAEVGSADNYGITPLQRAAFYGHMEVVRELLKYGAKVESADKDGWTPLKAAASNGHLEIVRDLLKHGAKLKSAKKDGRTPLYTAATNGHLEVVRELLIHGAKVESADNYGLTPLQRAAFNGHVEVVRELLRHGAKVESERNDGWTPLYSAALNGHVEVVRELLKYGAKVESADKYGCTPLNAAASNDHMEVVEELLKHVTKLESAKKNGPITLYTAASNGQSDVVQELLKYGAKVESADKGGLTPLQMAAFKGHVEVARELLKHGANVESAQKDGRTPLYTAASNGHVKVVRELLKYGADLESANNYGWTPLQMAAFKGQLKVVRKLLKHGAEVESAQKDGRTPLYAAASNGYFEVVRELLKYGAKLESADKEGWTPLNVACSNGHLEVVRELLKHGAKVESTQKDGLTPLYTAASNGHVEVVRKLLKYGAKLESANRYGWTPLQIAASKDHVQVFRELLKHGAKLESADNYDSPPLYSTTLNDQVEVVRELLNHDAKSESADNCDLTPLYSTPSNDQLEVVRELLKQDAKLESADKNGSTGLYSAALKSHVEVVRELLNHGAKVESADNDDSTPLYSAVLNSHVEVVRELLKHGAKLESADNYDSTPLYSVALNSHVEVIRELLKHGDKVESADKYG